MYQNDWQSVEALALAKVESLVPANYEVLGVGGSNSTVPDGVILKDGELFKRFEVKKIPSAAGVQVVVRFDEEEGKFISSQRKPFTSGVLGLVNEIRPEFGEPVQLEDSLAFEALQAFGSKYSHNGAQFFVGVSEDGVIHASGTDAESLEALYKPVLTVRPKRSGSRALPKKSHAFMSENFDVHVVGGRKMFLDNLDDVEPVRELIDELGEGLWVNDFGEFRKLGTTRNVTALLSLQFVVDSVNSTPDEMLTQLIMM